jgi:hypothetical protein
MSLPPSDVIAEDRLLWELWLNHGLDRRALLDRLRDIPAGANTDYLVGNAHYGCFEEKVRETAREGSTFAASRAILRSLDDFSSGPAASLTPESSEGRALALLALAAEPAAEVSSDASSALDKVSRWGAFLRSAARANIVPAVASTTARLGAMGSIPEGQRRGLLRSAEGIQARNRRLLELLGRILEELTAAGLTPLLLKETALQRDLYPGDGDRMVGDLDILLSPPEADEAERILLEKGYVSFEGIWSRAWYREHHHHLAPLVSAGEAVKIEPHTGIWIPSSPSAHVVAEMMAASLPHPVFRARRPSPTHLLFHLLVDLHGNAYVGKLGQAVDAARLIAREGDRIDAAALSDLARRTGSVAYLQDSLWLLRRLFGESLLARVRGLAGQARPGGVPLERRALRRMAARNAFGFEPQASALSLAGWRLLHKALMRPGGRVQRALFLARGLAGAHEESGGMGEVARRSRSGRARQLGRALSFPFRLAARWSRLPARRS